jgi:hypothetical protein
LMCPGPEGAMETLRWLPKNKMARNQKILILL